MHLRGRAGLRVEETARICDQVEQFLHQDLPKGEIATVLDNIGLPNSSINLSYSNSGVIGTSDAEILLGLNAEHHRPTEEIVQHLRQELPRRFPGVEFFFQPADIVTQILNFGLPAPIDIQVLGADMQTNYGIAQQIANKLRRVPGTADVHVQQMLGLPTLHLDIDRNLVTQVGMNPLDIAQSVLVSLSGSFQTAPSFWLNPKNGVTYQMVGAIAAIPDDFVARPHEYAGQRSLGAELAGAGESGAAVPNVPTGGGIPLRYRAGDRRLRQHARSRSGRCCQGNRETSATFQETICHGARASTSADKSRPCSPRSSAWESV